MREKRVPAHHRHSVPPNGESRFKRFSAPPASLLPPQKRKRLLRPAHVPAQETTDRTGAPALIAHPPGGTGTGLSRRHPRCGRWLTGVSLLTFGFLSLPMVAGALLHSLAPYPPVSASQLAQAQAIVILAGGLQHDAPEYGGDTVNHFSLIRSRYGARLQKQSGLPILVSGGAPTGGKPEGEAMKEAIEQDFGAQVRWGRSPFARHAG